ncbi:MAG: hypothetical protein MPL62_09945 [Alphaproteobacteria bacterium]|nr:hypothetical protein [Alphaproteobacteria bacterium]
MQNSSSVSADALRAGLGFDRHAGHDRGVANRRGKSRSFWGEIGGKSPENR